MSRKNKEGKRTGRQTAPVTTAAVAQQSNGSSWINSPGGAESGRNQYRSLRHSSGLQLKPAREGIFHESTFEEPPTSRTTASKPLKVVNMNSLVSSINNMATNTTTDTVATQTNEPLKQTTGNSQDSDSINVMPIIRQSFKQQQPSTEMVARKELHMHCYFRVATVEQTHYNKLSATHCYSKSCQTSRQSATIMVAAMSSCCLLLAVAILGQSAPTATTTFSRSTSPKHHSLSPVSSQQHFAGSVTLFPSLPVTVPVGVRHQQHNLNKFVSDNDKTAKTDRQKPLINGYASSSSAGGSGDGAEAAINVQPIIKLSNTPIASNHHHHHHQHIKSSEQKQQLQPTTTTTISLPSSASASAASSSSSSSVPLASASKANEEYAGGSADEEIVLLVLASDTSPSSSLRRLMKRSGISDQRLAEIQMIRALKKQLERAAATKIATESNNGGGQENGSATEGQA